ncbi:flagellar basal body protein FliL [Micromonospora sp. CP22]|uniref:LppU/SCO3897 family protein n=1 Tax=Micromonospora sp. CP22 TaxID=2580517 RepID=UPI0012BD63AB|nr:flagellar basal body protein FliL [Micromonospora sp. CP22]MTK04698.1 flagellar basal body protein FliL [Micromonospora sp. CP22]
MGNYGPPGPGPQPWHEPEPGEHPWREPQPEQWYGHGQPPGPSHDPGRAYQPGQPYGDQSYGDQSYGGAPGRTYGSGPEYPPAQHHGYGQDYGYGDGQRYGSGQSYDPGGERYDATTAAPDGWTQSADRPDVATGYAGTPAPPPQRRRGWMLVALAAVLVLALGGATTYYLVGQDDETTTPVAAPTEEVASTPDAGDEEDLPDEPAPASSADARFVQAGQCVRNEAAAGDQPRLALSDCVPRSYEVLKRFDGKTSGERDAEEKCAAVDGYTNWYFYDSELDSLDFVLCLKRRD